MKIPLLAASLCLVMMAELGSARSPFQAWNDEGELDLRQKFRRESDYYYDENLLAYITSSTRKPRSHPDEVNDQEYGSNTTTTSRTATTTSNIKSNSSTTAEVILKFYDKVANYSSTLESQKHEKLVTMEMQCRSIVDQFSSMCRCVPIDDDTNDGPKRNEMTMFPPSTTEWNKTDVTNNSSRFLLKQNSTSSVVADVIRTRRAVTLLLDSFDNDPKSSRDTEELVQNKLHVRLECSCNGDQVSGDVLECSCNGDQVSGDVLECSCNGDQVSGDVLECSCNGDQMSGDVLECSCSGDQVSGDVLECSCSGDQVSGDICCELWTVQWCTPLPN